MKCLGSDSEQKLFLDFVCYFLAEIQILQSPRNFCRINKSKIHQVPPKYLTDTNRPHKNSGFSDSELHSVSAGKKETHQSEPITVAAHPG